MKTKESCSSKKDLPKYEKVLFRIETDLKSFLKKRDEFLNDLASLLNTKSDKIRIAEIKEGCVFVVIEIEDVPAADLIKKLKNDKPSGKVKEFFQHYFNIDPNNIRILTEKDSPYIKIQSKLSESGRTLTWLHLSDIHIRAEAGAKKWQQDIVTSEFLKAIPGLLNEFELIPDFVFVTGDLSFSGKKEEYDEVEKFLKILQKKLPAKPHFYFVPGNHDITWDNVESYLENGLREKLNSPEIVYEHLLDRNKEVERKSGFFRLDNFFNFSQDFSLQGQPSMNYRKYFYFKKLKYKDLTLGIAGLNSAWRSTRKEHVKEGDRDPDKDNLIIGEHQMMESLNNLEDCQIKFVLFHHPPMTEWFKKFDNQAQKIRLPNFDFVLRGHEHESTAQFIEQIGGGKKWYHIAASSLFFTKKYQNGFNVVRINLDKREGIIFFWQFVNGAYWRKDMTQAEDGFHPFDLPRELIENI